MMFTQYNYVKMNDGTMIGGFMGKVGTRKI